MFLHILARNKIFGQLNSNHTLSYKAVLFRTRSSWMFSADVGTTIQRSPNIVSVNAQVFVSSSVDVWILPHWIWLVILFIPRQVRDHNSWSLLFPSIYSHTWVFPFVRVVLSVIFIPDGLCLWTNDFFRFMGTTCIVFTDPFAYMY